MKLKYLIWLLVLASPCYADGVQNSSTCTISGTTITCPSGSLTPGGGTGTVTSVSVTTQNGVSAVVTNPTTTPALAFTLGDITPSSAAIGVGSAITSSGGGGAITALAFTVPGTGVATALGNTAGGSGGFALVGTTPPTGSAGGDLTGTYPSPTLAAIISAGGPTGSATVSPIITYDAKGRLTAVTSATITPAIGSITGLGTGVATALGVNVGSAGAFVTFNGAGGTPSSMVGTNITGTAAGLTAGSVTTNANLTGPIASSGNATSITSQTGTGTKFVVDTGPTISALTVTGSFTATGLVANAALANSSLTINGTSVALGASGTVTAAAGTLTGTTLNATVVTSSLTSVGAGTIGTAVLANTGTSGHTLGFLDGNLTFAGSITMTGLGNTATANAVCFNNGTGLLSYNTSCVISDARLKTERGSIVGALDKLLKIRGIYYDFKEPETYGRGLQVGVIAQDVAKVFPEIVSTDSRGTMSLDYQKLTAPIIEALRELKSTNDNFRDELKVMRGGK